MDWENFDFDNLEVQDIINEFDPNKKVESERKFDFAISKLNLKSNEELTNLLERLVRAQKEIKSFPKTNTHAGKKTQLFLEFLSKFINKIKKKINE